MANTVRTSSLFSESLAADCPDAASQIENLLDRALKYEANALENLAAAVMQSGSSEIALRVTTAMQPLWARRDITTANTASLADDAVACASQLVAAGIDWECSRLSATHGGSSANTANAAECDPERVPPEGLDRYRSDATPQIQDKNAGILLKLVRETSYLARDNHQPHSRMLDGIPALERTASLSSFSHDDHIQLAKAYALQTLYILAPEHKAQYMTRLANLAQATEEGNQLVQSAKEHLNTRRSTRAIIPSYAIFPASTSGLLAATPIPFPTTNVEECSPYSRTESRNGSRNNSLFSVAVTPASYDSRATSPLASPVSSSPDDKDKTSIASSAAPSSFRSSRSSSIANPLLAQVLNRRLNCKERSHSLAGSPTSSVTACPSQSMASFAPLDSADLQHKLLLTREKPRSTSQGRAQTYSAATGKKSGTLPSSGVATSTLRALATLDVNRPGAPRTRTWSKRLSSLWSITDDPADDLVNASAPTTPAIVHSRPAINRRHSRAATDLEEVQQSAPVRPGGVFDYGGPLPPLDPALAKQERNSKLLEARECASCGARGGSFPQCARGCGTAWCSRDCRMENRKVHNVACRALAGAGAKLAREKAATIA